MKMPYWPESKILKNRKNILENEFLVDSETEESMGSNTYFQVLSSVFFACLRKLLSGI
jgi:hypothetical protein